MAIGNNNDNNIQIIPNEGDDDYSIGRIIVGDTNNKNTTNPKKNQEEAKEEVSLRPQTFSDFIGQQDVLDNLKEKYSMDDSNIAMAAINLVIGNKSFFVNDDDSWINKQNNTDRNRSNRNSNNRMRNSNRRNNYQNDSFETYKFNFGKFDGVRVANIISSICNSTNINGRSIGKIQIFNDYSLVDLPRDLHRETKNKLKKIKVRN